MSLVSIIGSNLGVVDEELEWNSIEELAAIISTHDWAPGRFRDNKRTISTLSCIDLLVLDVDDGCSLTDAVEKFKEYRHIIATSRNHQKEKNGVVCDRFRVVLFLDSTITNDADFKATWDTARKRYPFIDGACKDSSRFFYASPSIIAIQTSECCFPVSVARRPDVPKDRLPIVQPGIAHGDLWKSTLDLLLNGAPAGTRHTRLVSAVGNMREQGYELPEVLEKLEEMSERADWTQPGLSAIDTKTIERMFARDLKYPYVPKEPEQIGPSIIVNASELLDDTFAYLGDKDKVKGEPTGIDGLDALLGGGSREGEITVLMARAKTGKNTLYHHMMYTRLQRGIAIGYASRELDPASEVIPNLLSIAMHRNAWHADMTEEYKTSARQAIAAWQLYFAPGYGYFSQDQIRAWFDACAKQGIKHFVFDHFHYALLKEDHDSTASLIRLLKTLVKEYKVHLDLIVQPRGLREAEEMSLATLRGGAVIGQALDNLLIFERVRGETNISKLTLEVARHKLANLGHIFLQYNKDTTEFIEVDKQLVLDQPIQSKPYRPWERHVIS